MLSPYGNQSNSDQLTGSCMMGKTSVVNGLTYCILIVVSRHFSSFLNEFRRIFIEFNSGSYLLNFHESVRIKIQRLCYVGFTLYDMLAYMIC